MRSLFLLVAAVSGCAASEPPPGGIPRGQSSRTLEHGGLKRTYLLYVPKSYDPAKPAGLVLALHGGLGDGGKMVGLTRGAFNALAERDGWLVAYPDGVGKHWNDGRGVQEYKAQKEDLDDVGFLCALPDAIGREFPLDRRRIFVTGMSNGGMMSFRAGRDRPDVFAAAAPVCGAMPANLPEKPGRPDPISWLVVNGTEDPCVPYGGGEVVVKLLGTHRCGMVLSVEEGLKRCVAQAGCRAEPKDSKAWDRDAGDGTQVECSLWSSGRGGAEVACYKVLGGGHGWPKGDPYMSEKLIGRTSNEFDACEVIWEFFKAHPKPEGGKP